MFVGWVARRRISKEKVIFHDELFWRYNFLLYQSSTFFGYLTHFFSLFFEEMVVLHSSTNALVSGLPSSSSLNPLPPLPPSTFQQTHRHTNTLKALYSGYTSYDSNLLFVNKVLEVFFVNTGRLLSNQISRISVPWILVTLTITQYFAPRVNLRTWTSTVLRVPLQRCLVSSQ